METLTQTQFNQILKEATFSEDGDTSIMIGQLGWIAEVNITEGVYKASESAVFDGDEYLLTEDQKDTLVEYAEDKAKDLIKEY